MTAAGQVMMSWQESSRLRMKRQVSADVPALRIRYGEVSALGLILGLFTRCCLMFNVRVASPRRRGLHDAAGRHASSAEQMVEGRWTGPAPCIAASLSALQRHILQRGVAALNADPRCSSASSLGSGHVVSPSICFSNSVGELFT